MIGRVAGLLATGLFFVPVFVFDGCFPPPPLSTVNGPFLLPAPVLHGNLSILFAAAELRGGSLGGAGAIGRAVLAPVGRGKSGRSFEPLVVEVDVLDCGDDLDEVADLGDGPVTGGEGDEVDAAEGEILTDVFS